MLPYLTLPCRLTRQSLEPTSLYTISPSSVGVAIQIRIAWRWSLVVPRKKGFPYGPPERTDVETVSHRARACPTEDKVNGVRPRGDVTRPSPGTKSTISTRLKACMGEQGGSKRSFFKTTGRRQRRREPRNSYTQQSVTKAQLTTLSHATSVPRNRKGRCPYEERNAWPPGFAKNNRIPRQPRR